jgi:hypothetical protein
MTIDDALPAPPKIRAHYVSDKPLAATGATSAYSDILPEKYRRSILQTPFKLRISVPQGSQRRRQVPLVPLVAFCYRLSAHS